KHLTSASYRGIVPSRPALETWLQIAIGTGLLRTLGIAVTLGPRAERYVQLAANTDVEDLLADDRPEPEPVIPSSAVGGDEEAAPAEAAPDAGGPATASAPPGSPLPAALRHLSAEGIANPRGRERPVPVSRFAQGFSDELLAE